MKTDVYTVYSLGGGILNIPIKWLPIVEKLSALHASSPVSLSGH